MTSLAWLGLEIVLSFVVGYIYLSIANERIGQITGDAASVAETINRHACLFLSIVLLLITGSIACFMHFYYGDEPWQILPVLLICATLWGCAYCDRKVRLIPNRVLLISVLLRASMLALEAIFAPSALTCDLVGSMVSAAAMFIVGILCRLVVKGSIGFGDIKLLAVMGFYLQTDRIWSCVFFTMLCSFFYSIFLLLTRKATVKTELPFAPLLFAGTVLASILTSV